MVRRPLAPDEAALWRQVVRGVRPMAGGAPQPEAVVAAFTVVPPLYPRPRELPVLAPSRQRGPGDTLDGGWDRRLARGLVQPDLTIDLHGHTLVAAHAALDAGLARGIANHARLILLVTGRPPRERGDGSRRGVIRGGIADWLAMSRFADRIAAVRGAHPRHGGAGALYLVLRRVR